MNETAVIEPPTEPIRIHTGYTPERPATSRAGRWARAHGIYAAIAVLAALTAATTELPRYESILTGIALTNAALWVLRKIGGRP